MALAVHMQEVICHPVVFLLLALTKTILRQRILEERGEWGEGGEGEEPDPFVKTTPS